MVSKESFVYEKHADPVVMAFQDAYHGSTRRSLTSDQLRLIKRCLPTYRGLVRKVAQNPVHVAQLLFGGNNTSNLWYYPCDVIELRNILESKTLAWHAPIMLFSPKTAQILMPEYPICLVFDRSVARDGTTLGGIHLRAGNRLPMASSLQRIMIRDYLNEHQAATIYRIVEEAMGHVPTYLMTAVPGADSSEQRKLASIVYPEPPAVTEAFEDACGSLRRKHKKGEGKMSNWYEQLKISHGPADTFGKEFLIGKLPTIPDPEEVHTSYELPHKALSLKKGDRVAYRYTDVKLPVHNETKSLPMTRSLIQNPKSGTITMIDSQHIHVLWDGAKDAQKIPMDQEMFLLKVSN